jgi:hypothetical protein
MDGDEYSGYSPDNPPTPNVAGLEKIPHSKTDVWTCRTCGYSPNVDSRSPFCLSCGRDFWGNPGQIPPKEEKDPRAGIREDGV